MYCLCWFVVGCFYVMWGGVQQFEYGVGYQLGVGFGQVWVQFVQYFDLDFYVLLLGFMYLLFSDGWQVCQVLVLDLDEVCFVECEVKVKFDEVIQCCG